MKRLTKQAAARRLHKLASVAKIVKYDRAMKKLAGMPPWAAQQMNMASPGVGDAMARRWGGVTSDGSTYGYTGPSIEQMMGTVGAPKKQNPAAKPKGRNLLKKKSGGYKRAGQPAATMSAGKALMTGGALGYVPGKALQKRLKPQAKPVASQPAQSPCVMNNKAGGYKRAWNLQSMWGVKPPQESYWKQAPKGAAPPPLRVPDGQLRAGSLIGQTPQPTPQPTPGAVSSQQQAGVSSTVTRPATGRTRYPSGPVGTIQGR